MVGAVPLSFHQKNQVRGGREVINAAAEEDMIAMITTTTLYIKVNEEVNEFFSNLLK